MIADVVLLCFFLGLITVGVLLFRGASRVRPGARSPRRRGQLPYDAAHRSTGGHDSLLFHSVAAHTLFDSSASHAAHGGDAHSHAGNDCACDQSSSSSFDGGCCGGGGDSGGSCGCD